ncbi:MAG: hypothetical protein U0232_23125, partial [Thermomicrobiales bacterium]
MKRLSSVLVAAAFLASLMLAGWSPSSASAAVSCQTFPETGKIVCGRFLNYWQTHGGLAQQGLPLTDEFIEINPTDGKPYLTQYFERARFEYHPENQAPYDVLLGLLGREQLQAKYPGGAPAGLPGNPIGENCVNFPETNKRVCGAFIAYWQANGGLAQQGLPLTDLFMETNPTDGKQYPTQYFERARFEYHIENQGTPYLVLLGLLGREQIQAKYPNGLPVWGPTLAPLAGGQTYSHPSGLFKVNIPSAWAPLTSDDTSAALGIPVPPTGCIVTVMEAPAAGGLIALDLIVGQASQQLTGYSEISKDKVVVGGKPAYRRIANFTYQGVAVQGEIVYFVAGPLAGEVLCSTVPGGFAAQA